MSSGGGLPDRIDRAALERVLQRAAELQAREQDTGEALTADEVLGLGKEVGIPQGYLRQAMLEEQTRTPLSAGGPFERLAGPAEVSAMRVVAGEREAIERALLSYMEKHELVVVQRQQTGSISWERMTGMRAALRRGAASFESNAARFMMDRAELIQATVTPLEPGYCHVSLRASVREARRRIVTRAAGFGTAALAGTGVMVAVGGFGLLALAPLLLVGAVAWDLPRRFAPVPVRVATGLERALDHAEQTAGHGSRQLPPRTTGFLEALVGEVRRAIEASTSEVRRPGTGGRR